MCAAATASTAGYNRARWCDCERRIAVLRAGRRSDRRQRSGRAARVSREGAGETRSMPGLRSCVEIEEGAGRDSCHDDGANGARRGHDRGRATPSKIRTAADGSASDCFVGRALPAIVFPASGSRLGRGDSGTQLQVVGGTETRQRPRGNPGRPSRSELFSIRRRATSSSGQRVPGPGPSEVLTPLALARPPWRSRLRATDARCSRPPRPTVPSTESTRSGVGSWRTPCSRWPTGNGRSK
jgi:hypothetical protein